MNTKSKLKAISIGIAAIMMVSLLAAVTTVSASDITDCWIGEDDNKVYFTIYSDAKAEGYICLNIVNGAYLERKKYGLNAGETATLSFREYRWNGVDDVEVCADCVDSCCIPSGQTPQPDLIVSDKWEESVNEGVIVHFIVTNIGEAAAGSSTASLEINGIDEGTVGVPALAVEQSYVGAFALEPCPPLTTITVTVCADNDDVVEESDETNNCMTNYFTCPAKPDLVVIDKWEECVAGQVIVHFIIANIGDADAGESYATLFIDDMDVKIQNVWVPEIGPGGLFTDTFEPEDCTLGTTIAVLVCADDTNMVDESDEDNNCEINSFTCPILPTPDLVVSEKWEESVDGQVIVHFIIENIGGAEAGASYATLYINSVLVEEQNVWVPEIGPDGTFTSAFAPEDCPPGTTIIVTVCADDTHVVDESIEGNNCITNYFTCPGKPDLVVSEKWEEHEYICCGLWNVIVHYVVENIGDTEAGPSIAGKKIDGVLMDTDDVPALAAGKSYASAFDPEPCPPGTTINFTVCADNFDDVDEINETNNCMTNNCTCTTEMPDLVVINKWEEAVRSDGHVIVHFIIENIGDAYAGESEAALYIDRVRVQEQNVEVPGLGPTGTYSSVFALELCPLADNITVKVCADDTKVVDESNETNNCRTNYYTCPSQGPDLVIEKTVWQSRFDCDACEYQVNYTVTNIGNEIASWVCCGNNTVALFVDGVLNDTEDGVPALGPGKSWSGIFDLRNCTCANDFNVTVCADYNNVVDEGNESNNCEINPLHCGLGRIGVEKTVWNTSDSTWQNEIVNATRNDTVWFRGFVNNTGCCCNLTNVMVTDVLSASLEYVNATPTPSAINIIPGGTTTIEWSKSVLGMCNNTVYYINATVITDCGEDENTMTATATTCTDTVVTDSDTAQVVAPTRAGVSIYKEVWNGIDWADEVISIDGNDTGKARFRCTVRNTGVCQNLTFLIVWDTLQWDGTRGLEYDSAYGPLLPFSSQVPVVTVSTGKVKWDLPWDDVELSPGEEIQFYVNATGRYAGTYNNTQEVTARSIDQLTGANVPVHAIDWIDITVNP